MKNKTRSFNRTIEELKLVKTTQTAQAISSFNRTIEELKLARRTILSFLFFVLIAP